MRASAEDQGTIPGPPPVTTLRQAYALLREVRRDLLGLIAAGFREYGDIYRLQILGRQQVLVTTPGLIREVLVDRAACFEKGRDYTDPRKGLARFVGRGLIASNGDFWRRQRRLVAPALHPRRIPACAEAMVRAAVDALASWRSGEVVALDQEMMAITLDIVGRTLMSTDVRDDTRRIGQATAALHGMLEANNSVWTLLPAWWPTRQRLRERAAVRTLDEIVYRLIRQRRPDPRGPVRDTGDLASLLLTAEDEQGARMSDLEARDEIVTLFIAGHETSANALNWTFVLLDRHPEVALRLREEVDRVLAGRLPTADDLPALPLAQGVIQEALRLYPPAFQFMRTCVADTTLGGHRIARGTDVSIFPFVIHRDPRSFPEPERFDPDRFGAGRQASFERHAFIPFGGGARACPGGAFALMETTLVLALIASRYRVEIVAPERVRPVPGITLRPSGPLLARVHARG